VAVSPRRHRAQEPQDTAHGTTAWPTRTWRTPAPTASISATHSWPIANGPRNGTGPQIEPTTGSITPSSGEDECP
jgi:hypothetical protein